MKKILFIFVFISIHFTFAQINTNPKDALVKDPIFQSQDKTSTTEKIKLIHSDTFSVQSDKYNGNPFFSGNVQFFHQGSILTANEVILYKEQNFVKAVGNVRLQNADGSIITSNEMEYDGNTQRGIAKDNVSLTDPAQTIKTEMLYYDKTSNKAYFNTGGTITRQGNVIYTKSGTYNILSRIINLGGNVKIDNSDYIVEGDNIIQNQNTNTATFTGPTTITNRAKPNNRVFTESGSYNMNTKEVWLNKNSTIFYNGKTLKGDKIYYHQLTGFGKAEGNVTLYGPKERRYIKGGYGEIFEKKDSAMITQKPYAVKILEKDSIYFSSEKIVAYQKTDSTLQKKSFLRAFKKGRMFKSNAQARADSISFNETDGILHLDGSPMMWSGAKQITGEHIKAYLDTEKQNIDSLKVIGNAFAISKVDSLDNKDEFNQVKGRIMTVYFKNNDISLAQSLGNAQAITYADSQNETTKIGKRLGVVLSTCGTIQADFENRKVEIISCTIGAKQQILPMSKISKDKRFFTDFNWNTKDRLRKWQDIFEDSPNYPEEIYVSDNSLYDKAREAIEKQSKKNQPKVIKRERK